MNSTLEIAKPSWLLTLTSIAFAVAALYLAKGILVPLTLAALLSFMLSPVCKWLEQKGLGRIPSVLVTATLGFAMLASVVWLATFQMTQLAPKLPEYQSNLEAKLHSLNEYAASALHQVSRTAQVVDQVNSPTEEASAPSGTDQSPYFVRVLSSPVNPLQDFGGMFGSLLEVLGTTGIIVVLVVFFLIKREDLRDRFIHLMGKDQVTLTTQVLEDAGVRVSRYLAMLFIVNTTYGVAVGIGLYLIGVPSATLWGIIAAVLRFVPYVGPWIAAAMPIGLSLAISTGWVAPILTAGLFVVLELLSNNIMEPWLYGKNTGVSPVAVLLAAVFWMWLWGPAGLLLATPLTVCLLVVGKNISQLAFLDILLGTGPVFDPQSRIYQRLLAGDQEEAAELLDDYLAHQSLAEVYDSVLVPALAMAETHWQLGELNEAKHKFIMQSLKELLREHLERQQERHSMQAADRLPEVGDDVQDIDPSESPRLDVLCIPAHSAADEVVSLLFSQVLDANNCVTQAIAVLPSDNEMLDLVERLQPQVVCISATPPAAVMHARHMCKQLRSRYPKLQLVVGLWDAKGNINKFSERIGCEAAVVATIVSAQEYIIQLKSSASTADQHAGNT